MATSYLFNIKLLFIIMSILHIENVLKTKPNFENCFKVINNILKKKKKTTIKCCFIHQNRVSKT